MLLEGTPEAPVLALAPMEGISDAIVRDLLGALGAMDLSVTEFIRVAHRPVPARVLLRECPELENDGHTPSGVPVLVQLLGGEPCFVAKSAQRAAELGAAGVDLNFGCPAKRVNGSDGGASLLREPSRLTEVIGETRAAVPGHLPVSAKIRLGWEDPDDVVGIVEAAEAGGAAWITIHGRTKKQMYKPTADWGRIRRAADAVSVPVVANGDIFDPASFDACRDVTGCGAYMLGRGAFRAPNLFRRIAKLDADFWPPERCADLLHQFAERVLRDSRFADPERVALNRIKGWVRALSETYDVMAVAFETLKRAQKLEDALAILRASVAAPPPPRSVLAPVRTPRSTATARSAPAP